MDSLKFNQISFGYHPSHPVLHNISFEVTTDEIIGILGPNGAGKSTLLQLTNSLLRPQSGHILYNSQNIENQSTSDLANHITVSFQFSRQEFFKPTVFEEIFSTISRYIPDKIASQEATQHTLKEFGLFSVQRNHPYTLSGGEQRRLVLALRFSIPASFYIFDEPTANADYSAIELLREYILSFHSLGKGFIIASHDIEFLLSICDRILILEEGNITYQGRCEDFIRGYSYQKWSFIELPSIYSFIQLLEAKKESVNILTGYLTNKTYEARLAYLKQIIGGVG